MRGAALGLAMLAGLSGCSGQGDGPFGVMSLFAGAAAPDRSAEVSQSLSLFDGTVTVRGPEGYCVDGAASRTRTGFVVLVGCGRVVEDAVLPDPDGLLTVQIGGPDSATVGGNEETLAGLLVGPSGRAMLSETGAPEAVTVRETETRPGLVLVRYADSAARPRPGTDGPAWRAFLDLSGRSAVVTLRPFSETPLSEADKKRLIAAAALTLTEANRP